MVILVTSCAHVEESAVGNFQTAVSSFRTGFAESLQTTASAIDEGQIQRVLTKPDITDADFPPVIAADAQQALLDQVDLLVDYADALRTIADKQYRGGFSDSVLALADQAKKSAGSLSAFGALRITTPDQLGELQKGVGVFASIAGALGETVIDVHAQQKALAIIKRYNTDVQGYAQQLQVFISPDRRFDPDKTRVGLCALVVSGFRQVRTGIGLDYESTGDAPSEAAKLQKWQQKRRSLALAYQASVTTERATIARFMRLREAAGLLGEAHDALAREDKLKFWAAMASVTDHLGFVTPILQKANP